MMATVVGMVGGMIYRAGLRPGAVVGRRCARGVMRRSIGHPGDKAAGTQQTP